MRGRPNLYTSYAAEQSMLPTWTQRTFVGLLIVVVVLLPFDVIPGLHWLSRDPSWFSLLARVCVFGVAALGLNLLTGVAGQVSLGHAFFMGVGAYTAAILGAVGTETHIGWNLPIWIWLPAAGVVPAIVGYLVAPAAVRVRGLYLAFVTLGLVVIGQHVFKNATNVTGGSQLGRDFQELEAGLWRENPALFDFTVGWRVLGVDLRSEAVEFLFLALVLGLAIVVHKNIVRGRVGRAFQAIRDRDIAAEVMGVAEFRYKALAFATSSAFAGVSGALLAGLVGRLIPESWDLILSVEIIAMVLIGGAGTTLGPILGAFFVVVVPRFVEDLVQILAERANDGSALADLIVAVGGTDSGLVSLAAIGPGISAAQLNTLLFGALIIGFLIFEPLGLFGIWLRIRNYWKGWPFTY